MPGDFIERLTGADQIQADADQFRERTVAWRKWALELCDRFGWAFEDEANVSDDELREALQKSLDSTLVADQGAAMLKIRGH